MSILSTSQQSSHDSKHKNRIETTNSPRTADLPASQEGLPTHFSQRAVLRRLRQLQHGTLRIEDGSVTHVFGGQHSADLQTTIHVNDRRFYWDVLTGGSLGAAESYLQAHWDCENLVNLIRIMSRNSEALATVDHGLSRLATCLSWAAHKLNYNSRRGSQKNIAAHYDLSNEFFALFLDPTMTYSCGIFPHEKATLEEASINKYDRICKLLQLSPTDHVLEIGTGWGGFSLHAARHYGCRVTTTTISQAQHDFAEQRFSESDVSERITLLKKDYRDLTGQFDKIASIEMIEAVGHQYLDTYFSQCNRLLKTGGTFALQAITIPDNRYATYCRSVDFIQRYIFPGGALPSIAAMIQATSKSTSLQLVQLEEFSDHYARTLAAWRAAFDRHKDAIRNLGKSDRFLRTWDYYFCYCEGAFRERMTGLAQLVFRKSC
jgi:cyclopropane-fatty-acyl-phospholipid synthase